MAENTKIEWTDHSASPWHGCSEVSPGCNNCYARTMAKRNPGTLGVWGPKGTRVMSASFTKNCRRWNKSAKERGVIETVFPSICDPFEHWDGPILNSLGHRLEIYKPNGGVISFPPYLDGPQENCRFLTMNDLRQYLFALINECQNLRFLLLTKRPQNVRKMWPMAGLPDAGVPGTLGRYLYLENVSILASVSDQATFDAMYRPLLECENLCSVLGLSAEPLLGPIDASAFLYEQTMAMPDRWVIVGGESGHGARPCNIGWIRSLRDQCQDAEIACFVKQLGANVLSEHGTVIPLIDKKGGDWDEWGVDLRVREFPKAQVPA